MGTGYTDPLVELLVQTLDMMFAVEAREVDRRSGDAQAPSFDVSGVIGITGPTTGGIVLSFEDRLARHLTAEMMGEADPGSVAQEDVVDFVGEMANIVAGNFLQVLGKNGARDHKISLPSVVVGSHHVVWRKKDGPADLVMFETDHGRCSAEINVVL